MIKYHDKRRFVPPRLISYFPMGRPTRFSRRNTLTLEFQLHLASQIDGANSRSISSRFSPRVWNFDATNPLLNSSQRPPFRTGAKWYAAPVRARTLVKPDRKWKENCNDTRLGWLVAQKPVLNNGTAWVTIAFKLKVAVARNTTQPFFRSSSLSSYSLGRLAHYSLTFLKSIHRIPVSFGLLEFTADNSDLP